MKYRFYYFIENELVEITEVVRPFLTYNDVRGAVFEGRLNVLDHPTVVLCECDDVPIFRIEIFRTGLRTHVEFLRCNDRDSSHQFSICKTYAHALSNTSYYRNH